MASSTKNRYASIVERLFVERYQRSCRTVPFHREDIVETAKDLKIPLPKSLGDMIYSFRYRTDLPEAITRTAPDGEEWIITLTGQSRYRFELTPLANIFPRAGMSQIKIPDATPGIITEYALNDEQALLAKLRSNRLIDIFSGVTCYSLQSHLRTTVPDMGQVETDEVYVGVDKRGAHYVFPV